MLRQWSVELSFCFDYFAIVGDVEPVVGVLALVLIFLIKNFLGLQLGRQA